MEPRKDKGRDSLPDDRKAALRHEKTSAPGADLPTAEVETVADSKLYVGDPSGHSNTDSPEASLVGQRIRHVRVEAVLGKGGMGEVFRGFDETLERPVAIKRIRAKLGFRPKAKVLFRREAQLLSKLNHPSICQVYDLVEGSEVDYLILEYVDGKTLRQKSKRGLEMAERLRIAERIAEALAAAHEQHVVHLDLKPDNVMVTAAGDVKVLDFGIARMAHEEIEKNGIGIQVSIEAGSAAPGSAPSRVPDRRSVETEIASVEPTERSFRTIAGAVAGTFTYMSPEQARGEPVNEASDIYSLGLLLQRLFTGHRPYPKGLDRDELLRRASQGESRTVEGLSSDLTSLLEDLKRPTPEERPRAREVCERLRFAAAAPQRRRIRRRTILLSSTAAALLVIALAVGWRLGSPKPLIQAGQEGRIAVLPVDNATGDSNLDWVELGLSELVGSSLDRVEGIFVIPAEEVQETLRMPGIRDWGGDELQVLAASMGSELLVRSVLKTVKDGYELAYTVVNVAGGISARSVSGGDPTRIADQLTARLAQRLRPGVAAPGIQDVFSDDPFLNRLYAAGQHRLAREGPNPAQPYFQTCLREAPDFLWARLRAAQVDIQLGRHEDGRKALEELLEKNSGLDSRLAFEAELVLADLAEQQGRYEESIRRFKSTESLANDLGDPRRLARVFSHWGRTKIQREDDALKYLDRALAIYEGAGDLRGKAVTLLGLASSAVLHGRLDEAQTFGEKAKKISTELGDYFLTAQSVHELGKAAVYQARFDDAEKLLKSALDQFRRSGDLRNLLSASNTTGVNYLQWHRYEDAEPAFEEALGLARKIHDVDLEARIAYNLGMIQLFHRRPDEAESYFELAMSIEWLRNSPVVQCNHAIVHYERGNFEAALEELESGYQRLEKEMRHFFDPFIAAVRQAVATGERQPLPTDVE